MDIFVKTTAGILVALVVSIILVKQNKDISIILVIGVCCMVAAASLTFYKPVVDFFQKLINLGNLDSEAVGIVMKAVGIAILGEITGNICADAGNGSLGKMLQFLTTAVILWLSLPLFTSLIELIEKVLDWI